MCINVLFPALSRTVYPIYQADASFCRRLLSTEAKTDSAEEQEEYHTFISNTERSKGVSLCL